MNRRSFFNRIARAAAIVGLAPVIAFRGPKIYPKTIAATGCGVGGNMTARTCFPSKEQLDRLFNLADAEIKEEYGDTYCVAGSDRFYESIKEHV